MKVKHFWSRWRLVIVSESKFFIVAFACLANTILDSRIVVEQTICLTVSIRRFSKCPRCDIVFMNLKLANRTKVFKADKSLFLYFTSSDFSTIFKKMVLKVKKARHSLSLLPFTDSASTIWLKLLIAILEFSHFFCLIILTCDKDCSVWYLVSRTR